MSDKMSISITLNPVTLLSLIGEPVSIDNTFFDVEDLTLVRGVAVVDGCPSGDVENSSGVLGVSPSLLGMGGVFETAKPRLFVL